MPNSPLFDVRGWTFCLVSLVTLVSCASANGDDPNAGDPSGSSGTSNSGQGGQGQGNSGNSGGGAGAPSTDPAGIQYFGRWDLSDPQRATASWGAVYLKARFEGTSVGIKLNDSRNDFQYSIDGQPLKTLSPTTATEYSLATGLPDGEHTLEFYRRSGGSFGRSVVSGLILDEGKRLLPPAPRPARKIEILGDSISVGYGNENGPSQIGTSRRTENGYNAYGPQLARMLDAEWSVIAHSGQGLYRNLGEDLSTIGSTPHMPDEFKLTFWPDGGNNPPWNFSSWQPDVFIVTLGTNDFAWKIWNVDPGPSWEPTQANYVAAYKNFLTFVRGVYPKAEIFAVGTFIGNASNQFGRCNQYICDAVTETGDARMHCVDPSFSSKTGAWLPDGASYIGDWTHPTVAGSTAIAEHLRDIIKPIMNW